MVVGVCLCDVAGGYGQGKIAELVGEGKTNRRAACRGLNDDTGSDEGYGNAELVQHAEIVEACAYGAGAPCADPFAVLVDGRGFVLLKETRTCSGGDKRDDKKKNKCQAYKFFNFFHISSKALNV